MKIVESISHTNQFLSLEFFPPKEKDKWPHFFEQVNTLAKLNPLYVSVTYGAGGAFQDNTFEIASSVNKQFGLTTMAHLTCVGARKDGIANYLDKLLESGIHNILALRGDMPDGDPNEIWKDFRHASDLVQFIRQGWPEMGIATACYPDVHPNSESVESDLRWTCHKFNVGAEFAITQLFFDVRRYKDLVRRLDSRGITKPIIPGILPAVSMQSFNRILGLCGANIPLNLYLELKNAHDSGGDEAMKRKGIQIAQRQIIELLEMGVPGIHLYSLNNAELCLEILKGVPHLHN